MVVLRGCDMHPFASETTTLYGPAAPEMLAPVAPVLHAYVYGASPTVTVAVAVPLPKPTHDSGVEVTLAKMPGSTLTPYT
jgi:hypothetical protein